MKTVIHSSQGVRYDDNEGDYGFSGRACYAMALDRPNYPVPATTRVDIGYLGVHIYSVDAEYTAWRGPLWSWRP